MKRRLSKDGFVFFLAFLLSSQLATVSFANNWMGKESSEKKVAHLKKELALSDDQAAQVKGIFDDFGTKVQALHQEKVDRINAVLTPEQRKKYAEEMAERKEKHEDKDDRDGDKD